MKRLWVAMMGALSLASTAMGQVAPNFGSRYGGLGNAGGFATGSGFSNGSAGSLYFERNAGPAFANTAGLPVGGNAIYNYGGNAYYNYGGNALNGGNAYLGNSNLGLMNPAGPFVPGLGFGPNGLGVGGLDGLLSSGVGVGGTGLYGGGLGLGGGLSPLGLAAPGAAVPGLNYGLPGTGYGVPSPTIAGATAAAPVRKRPPEAFTNNAVQGRTDASTAAVPIVTVNALRIQDRIARSASRANFRNVKVLMVGRTVVLQGSVDSQADEQLVQRLVSLEPSVDGVISQLTYPGKAQTPTISVR